MQRALLGLAVVAGLVAGALYHAGTQRVPVVVAAHELAPGRPITESDLDVRWLPPDALPPSTISDTASAVGLFLRGPVWPGQLLLDTGLSRSSAAFDSGIAVPTGYRAMAIPVSAQHALGGAISPGARVDVIAVRAAALGEPAVAELLIEAALVIDVRGELGGTVTRDSTTKATAVRERLGSVVIAVGPSEELLVAERIPSSGFVLALVVPGR